MYAVLFCNGKVFRFHERDAMPIAVIVDIFELLQNLGALFTLVGIYTAKEKQIMLQKSLCFVKNIWLVIDKQAVATRNGCDSPLSASLK